MFEMSIRLQTGDAKLATEIGFMKEIEVRIYKGGSSHQIGGI